MQKFGRNRSSICELSYLQTDRRDETDTCRLWKTFTAFRLGYGLDSGGTMFLFSRQENIFLFSEISWPSLGPIQRPFQLPWSKAAGEWSWPLTTV